MNYSFQLIFGLFSGFSSRFDTTYLAHVSGLPWMITKSKVIETFSNVDILNGLDGIHFIIDDQRSESNQAAYIQLQTKEDFHKIQAFNRTKIGSVNIESNFQFFPPFFASDRPFIIILGFPFSYRSEFFGIPKNGLQTKLSSKPECDTAN